MSQSKNSEAHFLNKLNGWQRLWLVGVIIYFAVVSIRTYQSFPTKSEPSAWIRWNAIHLAKKADPALDDKLHIELIIKYSSLSDDQLIDTFEKKYGHEFDFRKLEAIYHKKIKELPQKQKAAISKAIIVWLSPSLSIYIVGLIIAWITKGFKRA